MTTLLALNPKMGKIDNTTVINNAVDFFSAQLYQFDLHASQVESLVSVTDTYVDTLAASIVGLGDIPADVNQAFGDLTSPCHAERLGISVAAMNSVRTAFVSRLERAVKRVKTDTEIGKVSIDMSAGRLAPIKQLQYVLPNSVEGKAQAKRSAAAAVKAKRTALSKPLSKVPAKLLAGESIITTAAAAASTGKLETVTLADLTSAIEKTIAAALVTNKTKAADVLLAAQSAVDNMTLSYKAQLGRDKKTADANAKAKAKAKAKVKTTAAK